MNGAAIVGRMLAEAGATHAFGIPGGEVLALVEGLDAAGIRFVLVKHENAGGFMAEGLWHATGALPVLVATLGPGVANAVNVVANAHQDRVPLIFLTGCVDAEDAKSYTHQVFDHQALLRPVVKATLRAEAGTVGRTIAEAVAIAREGQPGPVHVDVPISVAEGEVSEVPTALPAPAPMPRPDAATLSEAKALLAAARRPLAIAGVDAVNEGAGGAVAAFCRDHGVPLITSYKGKGLLPEDHPLSLGGAGLSPAADRILMPLIAEADAILLVGYDPIEMRIGWRNPWGPDKTVIEIAPVARSHGMHRVSHSLVGGIAATLQALAPDGDGDGRWPGDTIARARDALQLAFAGPAEWGPHAVFRTLMEVMPPETVVTADSGAHRILVSQMWQCPGPRRMLQSSGLCTMACAVPLAAGHAIGRPGTPVLAFVGDAGLEMGLGELATLRDLRLPVLVCVLVDESLALIEMKQRAGQRRNLGVDFGPTDFAEVARALGGHGGWIEDVDTLAAEAQEALQRDVFSLLACRIARHAYDGAF